MSDQVRSAPITKRSIIHQKGVSVRNITLNHQAPGRLNDIALDADMTPSKVNDLTIQGVIKGTLSSLAGSKKGIEGP